MAQVLVERLFRDIHFTEDDHDRTLRGEYWSNFIADVTVVRDGNRWQADVRLTPDEITELDEIVKKISSRIGQQFAEDSADRLARHRAGERW